jgi:endonuclease/exonuclease/phosphatase family metal-dependent hydrolase
MKSLLLRAPIAIGALFVSTLLVACKEEKPDANWSGPTVEDASVPRTEAPAPAPEEKAPAAEPSVASADETGAVRFVGYNLENWLTMDRWVDNRPAGELPKPDEEKDAAVKVIAGQHPDILGVCEIGSEDDLADLKARLADAGLDLPHTFHTGGADDVRHLASLSKFPITASEHHRDLTYRLENRTFGMGRGILDVTIETSVGPVRFLGAHLKSKREIPEADQEMMRRAEAHLLRDRADEILREAPETALIVYGDMNDTRQSSAIRTLRGPRNGPLSLKMANLEDSRGEHWTHFWSYQDVYSRFDYILFSPPLLNRMVWDECGVVDTPGTIEASDHRAVTVVFR